MLLPALVFSQTTSLAKWNVILNNAPSNSPTSTNSNVFAYDFKKGNNINSNLDWNGYNTSGWSNNINTNNRYVEFGISPIGGASLIINKVNFVYKGTMTKMQVRYSKNADFSNSQVLLSETTLVSNNNDTPVSVNTNISIASNQHFYVRIYAYGNNNGSWTIRSINGNNTGFTTEFIGSSIAPSPLNGTYTIGQDVVSDFPTIKSAITALKNVGVSGPVIFLLNDSNYNNSTGETFPLEIEQFAGTSVTNTVTFKPAPSKNVLIQVNNGANDYQATAAFKFNGADNIIFDGSNTVNGTTRNLTVLNNNTIGYVQRTVFWVASNGGNGATRITIKNTKIKQGVKNADGNFCLGIYSGNNSDTGTNNNHTMNIQAATANNSYLTVQNNDFINVKQGVYVNGGSTATTNVIVHQNDLGAENNEETIVEPACFSNVDGFEYTENLVYNLYRGNNSGSLTSAGIFITNNTRNGSILRNNMRNLIRTTNNGATFAGIVLASTNPNSNILVANNFILDVAGQGNSTASENGHGITVLAGGNYKIYHNTVNLSTNQPNGGYSAALYIQNANNIDVKNNIFVNNQTNASTTRVAVMIRSNTVNTNTLSLDYNNYFSNQWIGFYGDNPDWNNGNAQYKTTIGVWKSDTGKDANSINISPVFASATDLHIDPYNAENATFNNLGTPAINATVPKDIDGQVRNTTTPDMGADEFGPLTMPDPDSTAGIYCASATTWTGTAWSNGNPAADKDVIFNGDFTQTGGTFEACSVFVLDGASVNFISNANAIVVHSVNVEEGGALTFESGSNLTQVENDGNSGVVTVKRNGSMLKRLDYSLWGSPVTGTQTLLDFSPNTVANRFYVYEHSSNAYLSVDPETTTFKPGKGYLIRMPNSYPNNGATAGYNAGTASVSFEGVFEGTPNNGNVRIPLDYTSTNLAYNAVANPYPSPINVHDFIDANSENIEGTVWVWRKSNNPEASTYWVINKAGATINEALGGSNPLVADPADFNTYSSAFLNTGQGFIVKALSDEDLVFRNNMRKTHNSTYFFRTAAETEETAPSRFWLNVTNAENNAFSQAMVGYFDGATNGYDNGYDGKSLLEGNTRLYSIAYNAQDTLRLALQARSAFTIADVVPLGFSATVAGSFEITIDHADGIFTGGQDIYIVDRYTNVTHNLKDGNYTFTTEPGTFEDRFQIIYTTEEVLDNDNPIVNTADVVVYRNGSQVGVTAPRTIQSVEIYDMLGRIIYQNNNVNDTEFTSSALNTTQQVIIVRATLDNQQVVSKKIMLN